ncbi:phage portal protein [Auritidibacter ignavus]|uniref:phage portal protein n=1 Tax=Auritidibacter ignavus TaxID=678932 RepID=UPI0024BA770E|nr:phage portal protein [Auritidibacter ignavus]WHS27546.1 phage portal protein [Auritidibacter ignavus]
MSDLSVRDIANLSIVNVTDDEMDTIRALIRVWQDRLSRNLVRTVYYDAEQAFKDLNLMLPPQLKNAKFYLGWANMAVRKAAIRSQFDGLRLPGEDDPFELSEILGQNSFGLEFSQSVVSAYKHGVSFVTVARGAPGEPDVQIQSHEAESAAALWDYRNRRIKAGITISELDEKGPSRFVVYLDDVVLICERNDSGKWAAERSANPVGRALMVPVTYDPQTNKPFGRSRITNPVMSLTDMAVRAYVRMEGNAEFYSSPQLAIEGIDPEAFGNVSEQKKFKLAMDRLVALTRDEDGNAPTIKQMQQATMTPHSDMLRTVAMAFSGETGIPPSSLGIIHDQPSSAEAIRANEHDLLIDVQYQNKFVLSSAVKQIAQYAVMVRDGLSEPPAESHKLSTVFLDPEFRSMSARADAAVKLASIPTLADSTVLLEEIFDEGQIQRVNADRRSATVGSFLNRISSLEPRSVRARAAAEAGVVNADDDSV